LDDAFHLVLLIILCVNVLVGYYEMGGPSSFSWVAWLWS